MINCLVTLAAAAIVLPHEEKSFVSWMRSHNQIFTGSDYQFRFGVFLTNARLVREHNSRASSFRVGLNKFACITPSEYSQLLGRRNIRRRESGTRRRVTEAPPDSRDWRTNGIVNPIRDQGNCGSDWAFAVVQACESCVALKEGSPLACSEQNLIDCVDTCDGCYGGADLLALDYVLASQGGFFSLLADYPYTGTMGTCQFDASKGANQIASYQRGVPQSEDSLLDLVGNLGVCDVGIDASQWSFHAYTSGIYDNPDCSSTDLDHSVGCVGYGTENHINYWIVRNSWGTGWGEQGYIRMIRGKDNQCGIATDVVLPDAPDTRRK
jgi:cathepsin L